ncbi:MAG: hypothetical protein AAFX81_16515 [Pseudomonadota bacterium]
MTPRVAVAAALIALQPITPAGSAILTFCGPRDTLIERLADSYDETVRARLLIPGESARVVELLIAGDGQSWTLISTRPDGHACAMATGTDAELLPPPPAGDES